MTVTTAPGDLEALVAKHTDLLDQAQHVARTREFWSAFPESPSPRVYGENAAAEGEAAFRAHLGTTVDLGQPTDGTQVGSEVSPYGLQLDVRYPHAPADQLIAAAQEALPRWRSATPQQRAAVCAEILTRVNARSFEDRKSVV